MNTALRDIVAEIAAARRRVPPANRAKFDVESRFVVDAISACAANPAKVANWRAYWNGRLWWLTTRVGCHSAPPALVRRTGESIEIFIGRCCDAAAKGI